MDNPRPGSMESYPRRQANVEALDRFRRRLVTSWDETELLERGQEQAKQLLTEYGHAIVELTEPDELRTNLED